MFYYHYYRIYQSAADLHRLMLPLPFPVETKNDVRRAALPNGSSSCRLRDAIVAARSRDTGQVLARRRQWTANSFSLARRRQSNDGSRLSHRFH